MIATVSKKFRFEAAHQLHDSVPEGHKCRRLHGHSYTVEIMVEGKIQDGMVVDYAEIARVVEPLLFNENSSGMNLDHRNLNDLFNFETTAENLAVWFLGRCGTLNNYGRLGIRIYETCTTTVELWAN